MGTAHDRMARDLLATWRGHEIDQTDGMFLLFRHRRRCGRLRDRLPRWRCAARPPLRARAGIHVGPVIEREIAPEDVARGAKPLEIDGIAKPIAARVMAIARAGQTLLTAPTRATASARVP